jgi:hypothetical protein
MLSGIASCNVVWPLVRLDSAVPTHLHGAHVFIWSRPQYTSRISQLALDFLIYADVYVV